MPFLLADRGRDLLPGLRAIVLPSRAWVSARYPDRPGGYAAHYRRLLAVVRDAVRG